MSHDQSSFSFMPDPQRKAPPPRMTFDRERGERAKDYGMGLAADNRRELLQAARDAMVELAGSRYSREVDADDVACWLIDQGINPSRLGPATPSVFRGGMWRWTGRWRKSQRVSNHSRVNRVWRLL